jgi:anti-anti-sigma regulatory factor
MSDETKKTVDESESTVDKSNLIGVDPLAWLSEEEKNSVLNESKEAVTIEDNNTKEDSTEEVKKQTNTPYLIKLNDSITIRDISELMEELNSISSDETELVFESDQVEKVDAAALQLLLGFYLFAIEAGKKVIWDKPSEALCYAVELLGMKDIINLSSTPV